MEIPPGGMEVTSRSSAPSPVTKLPTATPGSRCCPAQPSHLTTWRLSSCHRRAVTASLTGTELEILGLPVDHWPDQRIATALDLPFLSVAEEVQRIQAKLAAPTPDRCHTLRAALVV